MKRTLLSLLMAAALLLPMALGRPPSVSASDCETLVVIVTLGLIDCTPFRGIPLQCEMTQVGASASAGGIGHTYDYVLTCGTIHVKGGYDVNTKDAQEVLTGNGRTITAAWKCSADPWIALPGQAPACTRTQIALSGDPAGVDISNAVFPVSVSPLSDFSRQVLNSQLQNAIKQLPPVSSSNQPSAPAPVIYRDPSIIAGWPQLRSLTQGEAVKSLQYLLQDHGATLAVDGKFGAETGAAVRAFQQAQGLAVDGIVGPNTWQALIVTVQQGSQGAAVQAVQSQLASRGQTVKVDGDFGSQTDAAVRAYQQSRGLVVDGQVGGQTWQALLAGR